MKHIFKKSIAACLALLILLSALPLSVLASGEDAPVGWDGTIASSFESGSGTEDDPFIIANGAQLAYLASQVDKGILYEYTYFKLGADIVLNDTAAWETWGSVDGDGYTVAPANVWNPIGETDGEEWFCGTFDGGDHTISGLYYSSTTKDYIGLFAGLGSGATLKNLSIADSYVRADEYAALLVGAMEYPEEVVAVSHCTAAGTLVGDYGIGAILGNAYASTSYETARIVVSDCVNNATVSGRDNVGGVVGLAESTLITGCVNNGAVSGEDQIAGILAYGYYTEIASCVNKGTLTSDDGYVGGVVGRVSNGSVTACRNEADIVSDYAYIGGVAERLDSSDITDCVNVGNITSQSNASGIIMDMDGASADKYAKMYRCANYGDVSSHYNAAGIGCDIEYVAVSECINAGNVTSADRADGFFNYADYSTVFDCYNTGAVYAEYYAAGLIHTARYVDVQNCYVASPVSSAYYAYPLFSTFENSTEENNFFLHQTVEDNGYGTFLTEDEAVNKDAYVGFDFLSVWEMGYDEEYAYPTLRFFGSQTYQYRISYQDGEDVVKTVLVPAGESIDLTSPENTAYDFAYWLADDGARYGVTDTVNATKNTTLTAVWIAKNTSPNVWDGSIDTEWAGSGTESDPFLISTPAELAGLSAFTNDPYSYEELYYNQHAMGAYYKQTADLLFNDGGDAFCETLIGRNEWVPIENDFYGHYDGDGHTISGIYMRSEAESVGVFLWADSIVNLTLDASYIYAPSAYYVGGIAVSVAKIENCVNYATIIGGEDHVGGVAGGASSVVHCENYGYVQGDRYVGGVVGTSNSDQDGVRDCVNYGTVVGKSYVGGVAGYANLVIGCENEGMAYGEQYIGGVAGYAKQIENSINRGDLQNEYARDVGGVVGQGNYITKCVNFGDVLGRNTVGGVVGHVGTSCADCYSTGAVAAQYDAGGIAGNVAWNGSLSSSYAVGTVSVNEGYVGGVVGYLDSDAIVTDCYYLDTACPASNTYGTSLSDAQMQSETAFEGFNFLSTWELGYDDAYAYPTLRDQGSKEYRYRVTYINEGAVYTQRTYYMGVKVNLTPPSNNTYDFAYWKTEDGTRYYATDEIKASEDMTLTAVWMVRPSGYVWDGRADTEWAGSGTADDPYLISTPAEFVGIAAKMEEVWWEDFSDTYFRQTDDFVFNAGGDQFSDTVIGRFEWEPIDGFGGIYDGDGHSIFGIYVNAYDGGAGLFDGFYGTLKNLTLADSYVVAHDGYAGGFAVETSGAIENCHNNAYVCSYRSNAGGIVASVWQDGVVILNSSNSGTVQGVQNVGGIVGDLSGGTAQGCSNSGTVSDLYGVGEQRFIGGIAGNVWYGNVQGCSNSGTVYGKYYIGGIVGYSTAESIDGCANFGTVLGLNAVGGVVGDNNGNVTNCYNSGTVCFDEERFADDGIGYYIGGVLGYSDASVAVALYNTGDVVGGNANRVGGVIGYDSAGSVRQAYSVGTVTIGENAEYYGAAIGSTNGTGETVYYLDNGTIGDDYATALSGEDMKTAEAYAGFDFDVNWTIDPTNADYPYPTLTGAPHKQYVTVTFVDPNGKTIASYCLEKGALVPYPDMSKYNYEDAQYVYEFVSWNKNPVTAAYDTTITATFRKVAKIFFTAIEKELTVGYGYSATNLQIDLESLYAQVICPTTTDYRLLSDVVWDITGYDPTVAGEVVLEGHLTLTDNPYYEMAQGAAVTVTVTVLDEGDTTHIFEANDLRFETLGDGSLKVIGYDGEAQVLHIPQTVGGKTVAVIGENAFAGADVLAVTLPATVHTVEACAFEDVSSLSMIVLPDSLHTVGERAFYNTALADVTCPASLTNIGTQAFGYYGATPTAVGGFTVYAFADTAAAAYAADNGFICVATQTAVDNDTDVSAVIPENLSLAVVAVGEGDYYDTAAGIFTETDGVKLVDISLYDGDLSVQPGGVMTVSMPIPDGFDPDNCHIFRINDDGSYKDMEAEIVGDRLVFSTAHLSIYAVIEQHEDSVLVGDMTGDGALNMRDALKMYQIASGRIQNNMPLDIADLTGDGAVNMRDALKLYQIVSAGQ